VAPWSPGANGNTSAEYVAAWRHVVTLFRQEGATNVRWVWSPNIIVGDGTPYAELYPGEEWVDWVGVDGYNFGPTREWHTWTTFYDVFAASYDALAALTTKPLMIAETASTEIGGDKAAWIRRGLLTDLPTRFPRFQLVIWFHEDKETDWRINSSPATLAAFREVLASSATTPSPTPTPAPDGGYTVRYGLPPCPSGKWTVSLDTNASEVAVTCQP
jgi:endoglucanase